MKCSVQVAVVRPPPSCSPAPVAYYGRMQLRKRRAGPVAPSSGRLQMHRRRCIFGLAPVDQLDDSSDVRDGPRRPDETRKYYRPDRTEAQHHQRAEIGKVTEHGRGTIYCQ